MFQRTRSIRLENLKIVTGEKARRLVILGQRLIDIQQIYNNSAAFEISKKGKSEVFPYFLIN